MTRAERVSTIHGLYGIADAGACNDDPVQGVAQFLEGGGRLIQLRCKDWSLTQIEAAGREAARLCAKFSATLILNDHAELVRSVGADGVHIGQTDTPPETVRRIIGPEHLIGWTTNDPKHLQRIPGEVDYLAYGPVWDSKRAGSHKTTQGLEQFVAAKKRVGSHIPLVAVGGINASRIPIVRDQGAAAWAVIGAVFDADNPVEATRLLLGA